MNNYLNLADNYRKLVKLVDNSYFYNNFNSDLVQNIKSFVNDFSCFFNIPVVELKPEHIKGLTERVKKFDEYLKLYLRPSENYSRLSEECLVTELNNFFPNIVFDCILLNNELA